MRVKFLQSIASATWSHDAGDVAEVDRAVGKRYIAAHVAEAVGDEVPVGRALSESVCPACGAPRAELQSWCGVCGLRPAPVWQRAGWRDR